MLSTIHVTEAANKVIAYHLELDPVLSAGDTMRDLITEVWELDPYEVTQVATELLRRGYSDPMIPDAK